MEPWRRSGREPKGSSNLELLVAVLIWIILVVATTKQECRFGIIAAREQDPWRKLPADLNQGMLDMQHRVGESRKKVG